MRLLILLAASLFPPQPVSLECANTASAQTDSVSGPGGVAAVLKVSSEDDYSKDSHLCDARYQLLLVSDAGQASHVVDLLTSDDTYGRTLSLRLGGFSQDGKRILGTVSEGGKHPFTTLFDYHINEDTVQLLDVTEKFAPVMAASCSATLEVIGTTGTGAIALELKSAKPCASSRRWLLDSSGKRPRPVLQNVPILSLYELKSDPR